MSNPGFVCANWSPEQSYCTKDGIFTCKNCFLVIYCGQACQKSHWPHHKSDCKSVLGKENWQPAWILENRKPAFIGGGIGIFGGTKYLWGNVPASDILNLASNEGVGYAEDLRILFAASGDIRNVIKTIVDLPTDYKQSLEVTMNDRDFDIVARNVIMLLVALVVEKPEDAADCIIHIWYSALVREKDVEILHSRIRPLIKEVCDKIEKKPSERLLGKTWVFGDRSLRLILDKSSWDQLLSFFSKPDGLTAQKAHELRAANTLAPSRRDYRDRYMSCITPSQRIPFNKFRQDGLLLPFGFPRYEFKEPNPTIFHAADEWPMTDNADPLHGWSLLDILRTSSGAASADIYGKLFYYLRGLFRSFIDRISNRKISLRLFQLDASSLPDHLDNDYFDRIDVSNISDMAWIGIHRTLYFMVPLLRTPDQNPYATLITLFMNVVEETMTDEERMQGWSRKSRVSKNIFKYLPPMQRVTSKFDPTLIKLQVGGELVMTYDHIFERFLKDSNVHRAGEVCNASMKEKHTIIEKWPYRLKLRPGQAGAQEEFDRAMRSGVSGKERYIEWKRLSAEIP